MSFGKNIDNYGNFPFTHNLTKENKDLTKVIELNKVQKNSLLR